MRPHFKRASAIALRSRAHHEKLVQTVEMIELLCMMLRGHFAECAGLPHSFLEKYLHAHNCQEEHTHQCTTTHCEHTSTIPPAPQNSPEPEISPDPPRLKLKQPRKATAGPALATIVRKDRKGSRSAKKAVVSHVFEPGVDRVPARVLCQNDDKLCSQKVRASLQAFKAPKPVLKSKVGPVNE